MFASNSAKTLSNDMAKIQGEHYMLKYALILYVLFFLLIGKFTCLLHTEFFPSLMVFQLDNLCRIRQSSTLFFVLKVLPITASTRNPSHLYCCYDFSSQESATPATFQLSSDYNILQEVEQPLTPLPGPFRIAPVPFSLRLFHWLTCQDLLRQKWEWC